MTLSRDDYNRSLTAVQERTERAITMEFPKLVVFDLDYTLWPLWIDTHVTPPLKSSPRLNTVLDRYNDVISFYSDVPSILHNLRESNILVAAASRTDTPDLARKALKLLKVPPSGHAADTFFDHLVIYPGSKIHHFRELERTTGIKHVDMLFFDDESRNAEVEKLGVTFVLIGRNGVTKSIFEEGLEKWRLRQRNSREQESTSLVSD